MNSYRFIVFFILAFVPFSESQSFAFERCSIWGDPWLMPFGNNTSLRQPSRSTHCNLPETHVTLFQNPNIHITVKNNRSRDVIVDFEISLFQNNTLMCRILPETFLRANGRAICGIPSIYLITNTSHYNPRVSIVHTNALMSIFITKNTWNELTHYSIIIFTHPKVASESTGMCRELCPPVVNSRSFVNLHSRSANLIVSLLASEVCRVYIDELQKLQQLNVADLSETIENTRTSCISDVSNTGNSQLGEDTIDNILLHWASTKIKELHEILTVLDEATALAYQIIGQARPHILQMVADSTWPDCKPESPYCIAPDDIAFAKR